MGSKHILRLWPRISRALSVGVCSSAQNNAGLCVSNNVDGSAPRLLHPCALSKNISLQRRNCSATGDDIHVRASDRIANLTNCGFNEEKRLISINWQDGKDAVYPFIFLRDNCQCPLCFHPSSKQRLLDTARKVDLRVKPSSVSISGQGKFLRIIWNDEHQSDFSTDWLRERILPRSKSEIQARNVAGLQRVLWNNKLQGNIRRFDFSAVLNDGKAQYAWLSTLATAGIALLVNTPAESGQCQRLSENFTGYPRLTNYGDFFTVKKKAQPSNLAYTMNFLPLHTDLPFYDYQPGIQLLHCIEQSGEGGDNQLVDGFYIANIIKEKYPDAFKVLTTTRFSFTDIGTDEYGDFCMQFDRPVIRLDQFGNVESISHNNHVRDSYVNATAEDVRKAYEAYYLIVKLMYEPQNIVEHKMAVGDILTFNNKRVLHGRTAYDASKSSRWLEGCYFDWDEAYSRMRVLAKRHNIKV